MFRSIWLPSLIVCIIALPLLFNAANEKSAPQPAQNQGFAYQAGHTGSSVPSMLPRSGTGTNGITQNASIVNYQNAPVGNPAFQPIPQPGNPAIGADAQHYRPATTRLPNAHQVLPNGGLIAASPVSIPTQNAVGTVPPGQVVIQDFGGVPDFGAAQTFVFPGNAHGPDLSAPPLQFMPVTNFQEIFRFDINRAWMKQRWKRISSCPSDPGLHGLRVALVTGTNSWDLHGALTYYFDANHRPQRITFRGWAGDETKLVNLLTQAYGFRAQPTHWAGFYIAQKGKTAKGGLLMQNPTVINTDNTIQQVAIVLEINNPQGPFELSNEFRSLIAGSLQSQ